MGRSPWPALLLAIAVSACGAPEGSRDAARDRQNAVRASLGQDPASLSLLGKADRTTEVLAIQITDSLVQYDPELRLQPRVASSWEWSDDHTSLTFHLRAGVRWHDGAPVTADDVVFTVGKARETAIESRTYGPPFRQLLSIEALDAGTVRARFAVSSPGTIEAFLVPLLPRHLAGRDPDLLTGEFARHPVGCGPFRFVSYRPGQEIVLEANDDYWDGRPHIDRLVFKIYPEVATAYQALLRGDLDVLTVPSAQWREAQTSAAGERLAAFVYPTLSAWVIVWNQRADRPFFRDARVRQALVHALDREEFVRTVAAGQAQPGITTFQPGTVWVDAQLRPRAYDPRRAAELLDAAGWRDGDGDGVRERDGVPFRVTLLLPASTSQLPRQIAAWEQQAWAAVGVAVEIQQLEWQAFRQLRDAGRFDVASFSLSFTPEPDQFFDLFHSSATDAFNFYGFADAEIDRLLETGRGTFDEATRAEVYRRLQHRLYELEPITCAFNFSSPVLADRRLQGITPSPRDYWRTTQGPRTWRWGAGRD